MARLKQGSRQSGFAEATITKKRNSLTLDRDCGCMEWFKASFYERERKRLSEEIDLKRLRIRLMERTASNRASILRNQNFSNILPAHIARPIGKVTEVKSRKWIALQCSSVWNGVSQTLIGFKNFELTQSRPCRASHFTKRKRQTAPN